MRTDPTPSPESTVGAFGEKLRKQREQRGLDLEAISKTTKISTRMLRALEDEHFDQLPGGIFNKGFVRAYARQVGLDEEETVADYLAALREKLQPRSVPPDFRDPAAKPTPVAAPGPVDNVLTDLPADTNKITMTATIRTNSVAQMHKDKEKTAANTVVAMKIGAMKIDATTSGAMTTSRMKIGARAPKNKNILPETPTTPPLTLPPRFHGASWRWLYCLSRCFWPSGIFAVTPSPRQHRRPHPFPINLQLPFPPRHQRPPQELSPQENCRRHPSPPARRQTQGLHPQRQPPQHLPPVPPVSQPLNQTPIRRLPSPLLRPLRQSRPALSLC